MLTRNGDKHYLNSLKARLEENGIPAVIQGKETARMSLPWSVFEPTLWIYIDEQFIDAVRIIEDPNYKAPSGVDIDEFYAIQLSGEESFAATNNALGNLALFVVFIMLVLFMTIKLLDVLLGIK